MMTKQKHVYLVKPKLFSLHKLYVAAYSFCEVEEIVRSIEGWAGEIQEIKYIGRLVEHSAPEVASADGPLLAVARVVDAFSFLERERERGRKTAQKRGDLDEGEGCDQPEQEEQDPWEPKAEEACDKCCEQPTTMHCHDTIKRLRVELEDMVDRLLSREKGDE
jgi:hypothetical protein